MRAIILAAGRGSRMGHLTSEKPKCFSMLRGVPLIHHQIRSLNSAGIEEIAIVTGYLSECFSDMKYKKFHNSDWHKTNMTYSLSIADEWLSDYSCIVAYSDIFYTADIVKKMIESEANITVAYDPNWETLWRKRFESPLDDAETFKISSSNRLSEIGKKPNSLNEIEGQYMGLLKFNPFGWSKFRETASSLFRGKSKNIHMTETLNECVLRGLEIKVVPCIDEWGEVDTVTDLNLYNS